MGFFKSLVDKVKDTRDELGKRAAKKAAETAIDQGAKAAKGALDSAGKAIERAIFGDVEEAKVEEAKEKAAPDPFAELKAREAEKKKRDAEAKKREAEAKKRDREVEDELAEMKKRLHK